MHWCHLRGASTSELQSCSVRPAPSNSTTVQNLCRTRHSQSLSVYLMFCVTLLCHSSRLLILCNGNDPGAIDFAYGNNRSRHSNPRHCSHSITALMYVIYSGTSSVKSSSVATLDRFEAVRTLLSLSFESFGSCWSLEFSSTLSLRLKDAVMTLADAQVACQCPTPILWMLLRHFPICKHTRYFYTGFRDIHTPHEWSPSNVVT